MVKHKQFIVFMLCFVCGVLMYCMVWYWAEISISPNQQVLLCNSDYNFDITLNTSWSKVVSSDVKFFIDWLELISVQWLWGFDQFNNIGTGISTKWVNIWKTYHYLNFHQNSFSAPISGSSISLARLKIKPLSGYNNWSIVFYNLSSNDEDSNIAVGIMHSSSELPTQYIDTLFTTSNGNYLFDCSFSTWWVVTPPGWGGGGGWWHIVPRDYCPDGDFSISYYDESCGVHSSPGLCEVDQSDFSEELKSAYLYSYMYGVTTMCPIQKARLTGYIPRNHFSKMISEFAVNVLWRTPDVGKAGCDSFDDISEDTEELRWFIKTACELNLMWLHSDGKTPKDSFYSDVYITRAQFGTVFSRLLFGDEYNIEDESVVYQQEWYRYKNHLEALKEYGVMTKIDWDWPTTLELKWWVMLMMQRADMYWLFAWTIPSLNGINALFN